MQPKPRTTTPSSPSAYSSTVEEPAALLAYLFATWPQVKKKQVRTWLKFQAVLVNGRPTTQFDHPLRRGDVITIRADRSQAPKTELPSGIVIRFEDTDILVIEKPEDLLSIANQGEREKTAYFQLNDYLKRRFSDARQRLWIVHRLDRETSGLMVFAKTPDAKSALQGGWDDVEKRYEAVVEGRLSAREGTFESDLDETDPFKVFSARASAQTRHAVTHYRVLATRKSRSLVELALETGRRHQIRVQLADAGCPVIGDKKYEAKTDPAKRLGLHASFLRFRHPTTGKELSFTSPLPKTLARLV